MAGLQEAPIVHGTISVSSLTISSGMTFGDGSSFAKIDESLDTASANPLVSSLAHSTIAGAIAPPQLVFYVRLVTDASAPHAAAGTVSFGRCEVNMNNFAIGGPNEALSQVTIPADGIFEVGGSANTLGLNNPIDVQVMRNGITIGQFSGNTQASYSTPFFLQLGDVISMHSLLPARAHMDLSVSLFRAA